MWKQRTSLVFEYYQQCAVPITSPHGVTQINAGSVSGFMRRVGTEIHENLSTALRRFNHLYKKYSSHIQSAYKVPYFVSVLSFRACVSRISNAGSHCFQINRS